MASPAIAQVYVIPTCTNDLYVGDSIEQALNGLRMLDEVMAKAFDHLESRIMLERDRVRALGSRVEVCRKRVDNIAGRAQATNVYSTAKFPGSKLPEPFLPLFRDADLPFAENPLPQFDAHHHYMSASDSRNRGHGATASELRDLHGRLNPDRSEWAQSKALSEGLGMLPADLPSTSSVLLFNSTETPYKQYNVVDALFDVRTKGKRTEDDVKREAMAAPTTMLNGDQLTAVAALDYGYAPEMGAVPTLEFKKMLDFGAGSGGGLVAHDVTFGSSGVLALTNGELILFTVSFCANPANDLTCPPSYIII